MASGPPAGHSLRRTIDKHAKDGGPGPAPFLGGLAVLLVVGAIVAVILFQGKTTASSGWRSEKPGTAHVSVGVQIARSIFGHPATTPKPTPTPSPTPTPQPTVTPKPTPTPKATDLTPAQRLAKQKELAHQKLLVQQKLSATKPGSTNANKPAAVANAGSNPLGPAPNAGPIANGVKPAVTPAPAKPAPVTNSVAQPTPAPAATDVYAPEVVVDAKFVSEVRPDYPEIAREQGASGTAVIYVTIGPKGSVISARVGQSTGNSLLDQSALRAARASSFAPPRIDGKPATETYRVVYQFSP